MCFFVYIYFPAVAAAAADTAVTFAEYVLYVRMSGHGEDVCLKCLEPLSDDVADVICTECKFSYHFGTCSGIAESTFKSKGEKFQRSWRCETCSTSKTRSGQGAKTKKDTEIDVVAMLTCMNKKLNSLLSMKETVDSIEVSVQSMSDKYDELLEHVNQQDKDIKNLKKRVQKIENTETEGQLVGLKQDLNQLEWCSRKQNLEVHGVRQAENEDLLSLVNQVAVKLDVPLLTPSEIVSMHRLPSKPDKVPGIIVRFAQQQTRDHWLDQRRNLKRPEDREYLLENMTRQDKALLWSTKEWARENNYQFVWHRNGNIFIRRKAGDRATPVRGEHDLLNLN